MGNVGCNFVVIETEYDGIDSAEIATFFFRSYVCFDSRSWNTIKFTNMRYTNGAYLYKGKAVHI